MDEKDMEKKIEHIAVTTLGRLKGVFVEQKLDDRQATLSLHYFLGRLIVNGWKGQDPVKVLENAIEVIKST